MSGFYELPFGRGKTFFSGVNRWADAIIGGWQIQGTYIYQSGFPLRFANDAFYLGGQIAIPRDQQTVGRWFNTSAFVSVVGGNPTCGAFTAGSANCATPVDHLRTLPFYFADVRSDPTNNADLGLRKDIRIRERHEGSIADGVHQRFQPSAAEHGQLPAPVMNPGSATFGQVVASNQQNYARRAQLMAEVYLLSQEVRFTFLKTGEFANCRLPGFVFIDSSFKNLIRG